MGHASPHFCTLLPGACYRTSQHVTVDRLNAPGPCQKSDEMMPTPAVSGEGRQLEIQLRLRQEGAALDCWLPDLLRDIKSAIASPSLSPANSHTAFRQNDTQRRPVCLPVLPLVLPAAGYWGMEHPVVRGTQLHPASTSEGSGATPGLADQTEAGEERGRPGGRGQPSAAPGLPQFRRR